MTEKIRELITGAQRKLSSCYIAQGAMKYILWYALTLIFTVSLYLIAWIYEAWSTGKPDMAELRNFIHEIASSPWVAAIGFVAQMLVDRNNDGIPDSIENKEEENGKH
jgi:hypothetical protein